MAEDPDIERIRRKAHDLWVAEGHPHGRDRDHWDQAREIIALEDSQATTLLPRTKGAKTRAEPKLAVDSLGDVPGLTDQGPNDLTSTSREPALASPSRAAKAKAKPAASPQAKPAAETDKVSPTPPAAKPAMAAKPAPAKASTPSKTPIQPKA